MKNRSHPCWSISIQYFAWTASTDVIDHGSELMVTLIQSCNLSLRKAACCVLYIQDAWESMAQIGRSIGPQARDRADVISSLYLLVKTLFFDEL
jgi:hypothetical protein